MFFSSFPLWAQFSGYQSLHLPSGARNAALGGKVVSLADKDINQFTHNPASLDSMEATQLSVTYSPYFAGINQFIGHFYAPVLNGVAVGLSYLDYGAFIETDPTGTLSESFKAQDYVITVGKSHRLGSFTFGLNLKFVNSSVESYGSSLLLGDLGGIYHYPGGDFKVGLVLKNFGFQFSQFSALKDQVPFDVQFGTSVKPKYMPVRFTITAYNLVSEGMVFRSGDDLNTARTVRAFDSFFRRINVGMELILSRHVNLLVGYNHLRKQELKLEETGGGAGFSYGLMIAIKRFEFRYGRAVYHASSGANFFTLTTNINSFKKVF